MVAKFQKAKIIHMEFPASLYPITEGNIILLDGSWYLPIVCRTCHQKEVSNVVLMSTNEIDTPDLVFDFQPCYN